MTRVEEILNAITNGETTDLKPISDIERYYLAMLNGEGDVPEPNTPIEAYLYNMCIDGGGSGGDEGVSSVVYYELDSNGSPISVKVNGLFLTSTFIVPSSLSRITFLLC